MTDKRFLFPRAPRRVYWETTRACGLVCRHCRADALASPHPDELTPTEGRRLLDDLARFGQPRPHVVFTGGDPLERMDLFELIRHARGLGLGVSVAPSATPRLDEGVIAALKASGAQAISLSLDGASAAHHAALRGVPGCFARTIEAAVEARTVGLPFQVNTLVSAETVGDLGLIHEQAVKLGAARWSLFFLVTVGRGAVLAQISQERFRQVLEWLLTLPSAGGPIVATTEAPQLRRLQLERSGGARVPGAGIRDGNGIMFVSHTGDIRPSGVLAVVRGQCPSRRRRHGVSNVGAVSAAATSRRLRRSVWIVPLSRSMRRLAGPCVRRFGRSLRRRSVVPAGTLRRSLRPAT